MKQKKKNPALPDVKTNTNCQILAKPAITIGTAKNQEAGDYISQNKTYASLDRQNEAMWATFSAQTV